MQNISKNGIIELVRGDTFRMPIYVNDGNDAYPIHHELANNEQIYFAIMDNGETFETAIIKKVLTKDSPKDSDGCPILRLQPFETEHLRCGKYYYTAKLKIDNTDGSYDVNTIIPELPFYIM